MADMLTHQGERYVRIDPADIDFSAAATVHKVTDDYAVRETAAARALDTRIDGHMETHKITHRGDWLVYNIGAVDPATIDGYAQMNAAQRVLACAAAAECYAPPLGTFEATHDIKHPVGDGVLASPKSLPRLCMQVPFNTVLSAPWGSDEFIKAGGYIAKDDDKIYGIAQKPFERTYGAITQTRPFFETHAAQLMARTPLVPQIAFNAQSAPRYAAAAAALRQKD